MSARAPSRKLAAPEDVLRAIVAVSDDGFCRRSQLLPRLRPLGERELRRSVRRAASRGLVLERRGPDGAVHVAIGSEGWELIRSAQLLGDEP
jgi:hypothetical protein